MPHSLASLHAVPDECEVQLGPEHVLVGHIMSTLATVNSWSRITPLTVNDAPEALSWQKLEAACLLCDVYRKLVQTVTTGSDKLEDWDSTIKEFYPQ